jgi:competence protein ComGC
MKKLKTFTLIELILVLLVILGLILFPGVNLENKTTLDAKQVSAQAACKTFEDSIFIADTKNKDRVKNSAMGRLAKDRSVIDFQNNMYLALAGIKAWDTTGSNLTLPQAPTSPGKFGSNEILFEGKYYEAQVNPDIFELNDDRSIPNPNYSGFAPFIKTKFGTVLQVTYRLEDTTIRVLNPANPSVELLIHGIKRFSHPVRIVAFNDDTPAKLITRYGIFQLYSNDSATSPILPNAWATTTEAWVKSK